MKKNNEIFSYILGLLSIGIIGLIFISFIGYKIGFKRLLNNSKKIIVGERGAFSKKTYKDYLYLPDNIRDELILLKAPIGNAINPTNLERHTSYITKLDKNLGWDLIENTAVDIFMLKTNHPLNLDPPVLALKTDSYYSKDLKEYLKTQTRMKYKYSINELGHRTTIPIIKSNKKLLIIGDSVGFGIGVADSNTVASKLQKILGESIQINNASVGGYTGHQAVKMGLRESSKANYSNLIYIACQNDFRSVEDAKKTLTELKSIENRFQGNVLVFYHTYMEYNLEGILQTKGWWEQIGNPLADSLNPFLLKYSSELGFNYLDWSSTVDSFKKEQKSIFAPFALYADHCHLSPLGNELMAQEINKVLNK